MKHENKKELKIFAIILIVAGTVPIFAAFFTKPIIAALLSLVGHFLIIIAMLLLFIYKNEN